MWGCEVKAVWLVSGLSLALSVGVKAQEPTRERTRERPSVTVVPERQLYKVFPGNRGMIGITVSLEPEFSDSIGALVDAVTPGGPAYDSGIQVKDVITDLNGRSLVQVAREGRMLTPGMALIEMASQLKAGDTARIEYRRGRDTRRVSLVLEKMPVTFEGPVLGRTPYRNPPRGFDEPEMFFSYDDSPFFNMNTPGGNIMMLRTRVMELELAPMNPGLGQYFGVADGVLVISVPENNQLNLRAGDVVLAVDGRKMANPGIMFRALSSYEAGEQLVFDVMRMKRRQSVTGKMGPNP